MNLPFLSVKILKPDVPPKRCKAYVQLLNAWVRLRSLPAWYLLALRHTVAKQCAAAERKVPWRPRS
jgi:hypothetical protein